jgi:tetratricopeptide (TPR) repeat protein
LVQAGVTVTLVNFPAGRHAFDLLDSTETSARVIAQTLDFAANATSQSSQRALAASIPEVRASAAFVSGRWADAVTGYQEVARARPTASGVQWRLGLAQLENGENAAALVSLTRARELGVTGPRDVGIPAARAAFRAGEATKAAEWVQWALGQFPRIREFLAADEELKGLLDHPLVKSSRPQ